MTNQNELTKVYKQNLEESIVSYIAEKTGLTSVTVRRYMNYLAESGKVIGEMNYETGGRPCMQYKVCK